MRGILTSASMALLLCSGVPAFGAPCDGSSDPCTIDLGRASASFASGAASYVAEAVVVSGSDMSLGADALLALGGALLLLLKGRRRRAWSRITAT